MCPDLVQKYSIILILGCSLWLTSSMVVLAQDKAGRNKAGSESRSVNDNNEHKHAEKDEDEHLLDTVQYALTSTVNTTARWVDGFFGDPRWFDDQPIYKPKLATSEGRLVLGPRWDQADGWGTIASFRARLYLPHMENRFSAVIGRVSFDEFITGDEIIRPVLLRSPNADNEWLIGFGYDPIIQERRRLSLGAGFRDGLNFDPYARVRYLEQRKVNDRSQLRWQSVGFWRNSDGFGGSLRLDYEIGIGERWLGRWSGRGTFAERSDGVRWRTLASLFYLYSDDRAYASEVWIQGETAHPVPLRDYGFRGIYRQRYLREWFFIEPWVGLHWPRDELDEKRETSWIIGLQFEIIFGQKIMHRGR